MNESQVKEFCHLLDLHSEQIGKPKKSIELKMHMIKLLSHHGFDNLIGAINSHMCDKESGMYDLTIANIELQISKAMEKDGRPCADEAWAIAIQLDDEQKTVVTNDDINKAWGFVSELMPDETAARMAFRKHYKRVCDDARVRGETPNWFPSVGFDASARDHVLKEGIKRGLLSNGQLKHLLIDADERSSSKALEYSLDDAMQFDAKKKLNELMQSLKLRNE